MSCPCGRSAHYPLRLAAATRPDMALGAFARLFKCQSCGTRPGSMDLVDHPQWLGKGFARTDGSPSARAIAVDLE